MYYALDIRLRLVFPCSHFRVPAICYYSSFIVSPRKKSYLTPKQERIYHEPEGFKHLCSNDFSLLRPGMRHRESHSSDPMDWNLLSNVGGLFPDALAHTVLHLMTMLLF